MKLKPMEYYLEVYMPGSADQVWESFESTSPLMAIGPGDIVNPGVWEGSKSPMRVLRVVNVEHIVWQVPDHIGHKVMVFTEEVEGTEELRLASAGPR